MLYLCGYHGVFAVRAFLILYTYPLGNVSTVSINIYLTLHCVPLTDDDSSVGP